MANGQTIIELWKNGVRVNKKTKLLQNRRPKFRKSDKETLPFIKSLRIETEKSNKKFLKSVFSRVNGDVNRRRHRIDTIFIRSRKTNTKSR